MEVRIIRRRPRSVDDRELCHFTLLNLLFRDALVAVVVVVCYKGPYAKHDGNGNGNENVTKQKMSKTVAVHVRYNSWYISLPSSAKQQREMTKVGVVWRT